MRFLGRSLIALFLLALTLGLVAVAGNTVYGALQDRWAQEEQERPARERVFAVNVITATPETIAPELRVFGEVRAARVLELRSPVGGTIVSLMDGFEEGGAVIAGDVILRVDPAEAEAALATAQNDLAEAEAEARDATRNLDLAREEVTAARTQAALRAEALRRQENLQARGVGTEAAIETAALALSAAEQSVLTRRQAEAGAEARVDQAATAMERRRIAVQEAARKLEQTVLRAEFDGTLSDVSVVQGGRVNANEQIARVIDPTALEIVLRLSTTQHARLLNDTGRLRQAPLTAVLDVLGLEVTAQGQIIREAPAVGEGQTGRQVFASLDASAGFRPGDFVEVRVQEPPLDRVTRLPSTAVNAQNRVLVVTEDERLEEFEVAVLRRQGDDVLVRAPELAGRSVVVARTPLLGAGIKVRPLGLQDTDAEPTEPELVDLAPDRRAALIAFVEGNTRMPPDVKEQMLARLKEDRVPAEMVSRLESRMGS